MKVKKFSESVAASCRYGEVADEIWGDWDLVWEHSYADYQGSAEFLAYKNGEFVYYEWDYGSCSGCDTWEAADMSDEQVAKEMQRKAATMDAVAARKWVEMQPNNDMQIAFLQFCVDSNVATGNTFTI